MGLTGSDAVCLLLTKAAHEKAMPFSPLVPDAVTMEAMKEAGSMRTSPVGQHRGSPRRSASAGLTRSATPQ